MMAQLGRLVLSLPSTARLLCPYFHCFHVCRLSFTQVEPWKPLFGTEKDKI